MKRITRRHFGVFSSGALISAHLPADAQGKFSGGTDKSPDEWILQWKAEASVKKDLQGPLDLRRFKDPFYALLNGIGWRPSKSEMGLPVQVPRGFVTDFASVPRPFWSIFPPDGKYAYAAVLHDWLYWIQDRSKEHADMVFRSAMNDLTITDAQSLILYKAVDLFGKSAWNKNAALKQAGEERVLTRFPDKPEISWIDWKNTQGVFK